MFWQTADTYERANGRIGREVEFALPKELSRDAQVKLAQAFAREVTKNEHPYTLAVHVKREHNPHAHLIFSQRTLDGIERPKDQFFKRANSAVPEKGGARKDRVFTKKTWLAETRELWTSHANKALEDAGLDERISDKSLKEQGIGRVPGRHAGPQTFSMVRRGKMSDRADEILETANKINALSQEALKVGEELTRESSKLANSERRRGRGYER